MSAGNLLKSELNNLKSPKFNSARGFLEMVVAALNGRFLKPDERSELVEFVELWNKSGRNPYKNPFFDAVVSTEAKWNKFSLANMAKATKWELVPVDGSGEPIDIFDEGELEGCRDGGARWFSFFGPGGAAQFALMLLTNRLRGKLSDGPCQRPRCGRWFIKRRREQKTCSGRCLGIVRSMAATKIERGDAKKEALQRARKSLRTWRRKSGTDWKTYVSQATGLTKKFLTRAVTKGELREPGPRTRSK